LYGNLARGHNDPLLTLNYFLENHRPSSSVQLLHMTLWIQIFGNVYVN